MFPVYANADAAPLRSWAFELNSNSIYSVKSSDEYASRIRLGLSEQLTVREDGRHLYYYYFF